MKKSTLFILTLFFLAACSNPKNNPDVSSVQVDIQLKRFDQRFFALDTAYLELSLSALHGEYPSIMPVFMENILGLNDSSKYEGTRRFLRQNRFIADSVNNVFKNTEALEKELELAFRYVKYYFPQYKIPQVFTIIGPVDLLAQTSAGDMTPDFLGPDFLGISLQFYLGKNFSLYKDGFFISSVAPEYRSRRFDKKYIVADCMKLVTDDLFPEKTTGKGLAEQMIEKGKQWWLLDKFMPFAPDSVKTGYTRSQLEWCEINEGLIWNSIITNEKDIFTTDPATIQTYIGEAPYTQVMPEASPGNIGQWVGWQIVKRFADKNPGLSLADVMNTQPRKILEAAKYKPK